MVTILFRLITKQLASHSFVHDDDDDDDFIQTSSSIHFFIFKCFFVPSYSSRAPSSTSTVEMCWTMDDSISNVYERVDMPHRMISFVSLATAHIHTLFYSTLFTQFNSVRERKKVKT